MKKLIVLLVMFLMIPVAIFAQDPQVPTTWNEVISQFNVWFGSLAGIAAVVVFLTAAITTWLKVVKGIYKQLIAWALCILLILASSLFNIGFAADFSILKAIVYGIGGGLVANGIFDISIVKVLLEVLKLKDKPAPTV